MRINTRTSDIIKKKEFLCLSYKDSDWLYTSDPELELLLKISLGTGD